MAVTRFLREMLIAFTPQSLERVYIEHLPVTVISAGGAGNMGWSCATAFRAFVELRSPPAVCSAAHA